MGFNRMPMPLALLVCLMITMVAAQTKPGCNSTCGDLNIPYPFGTTEGCYKDETFKINCFVSSAGTLMANYSKSNFQVLNMSLSGELRARVTSLFANFCHNSSGAVVRNRYVSYRLGMFTISSSKNRLYGVGCSTYVSIDDYRGAMFSTGCITSCRKISDVTNGTCSGIGCCESSFASGYSGYNITLGNFQKNRTDVYQFNPCGYGFIAEVGAYNFSSLDLKELQNKDGFPFVLNWTIGDESCAEAKKNMSAYACKENSMCVDSHDGGYKCTCVDGFQGNP